MGNVAIKTDAGKLEFAVYSLIQPELVGICDFVKVGARNTSINEDKMVYCNAPLQITDLNAIGKTKMRIEIYVKQIGGFKDIVGLSEIRDIIIPIIDGVNIDDKYFITYSDEISSDDNAGFNFIFLNLYVTFL